MQKRWVRVLLWVLTIALCAAIFGFSEQDGEESMATSGLIAVPIANWIAGMRPGMTGEEYLELLDGVQAFVRKTAHFSEYAVLGILVYLLGVSYARRHPGLISVASCLLYASGDEVHQFLGGSRTGMVLDVLLDTAGAAFGALMVFLYLSGKPGHTDRGQTADCKAERAGMDT